MVIPGDPRVGLAALIRRNIDQPIASLILDRSLKGWVKVCHDAHVSVVLQGG